ncbi:DUF3221 domain-containing protein [Paenibacillus glycanilyticus]|uniref:DUF3221 domain-containing protein n=1 Tax=Paenibacillus glycanilyticus TaxID=126569 RepID=A0ABQ6GEP8_9BACL|nr:DUF3221 domain-containing protein [Paenibacillus glycanilyticus]GLX69343.1 hypothetical protein MU1_36880 [Paenibacillus glycanilyticus]
MKRLYLLCLIAAVIGLLMGCSKLADKGDYVVKKTISSNTPEIYVVHEITAKDAKTKSLSYFLTNEDHDDVMIYHVNDRQLYNDLQVGERVTVRAFGYTMLSYPPQAVADEIIRYPK